MNKRHFNSTNSGRFFVYLVAFSLLVQLVLGGIMPNYMSSAITFYALNGIYALSLGALAVIYTRFKGIDMMCGLKLNRAPQLSHTMMLVVIVVVLINVMVPINEAFLNMIESIGLERPSVDIPNSYLYEYLLLAVIVVCIIPAITEEIVFRGVIGTGLCGSYPKFPSVLLSGMLFAIFHTNPAQTLHQFVLGCILTLFVMRSGSLYVAIIGHFINNLSAIIFGATLEPMGIYQQYGGIISAVGAVVVVALLLVYCKWVPSNTILSEDERETKLPMTAKDKLLFCTGIAVVVLLWVMVLVS